jgi:hypothetical protein
LGRPEATVLSGVVTAIIATVFCSAGFVTEKVALDRLPELHPGRARHLITTLLSSSLWVTGFALVALGLLLQIVALSLAPISVVQPVFACGLGLVVLLGRIRLKERLSLWEQSGVLAIGLALLLIGLSLGSTTEMSDASPALHWLAPIAIPTIGLAALAYRRTGRFIRDRAWLYAVAAGLLYGLAGLAAKQIAAVIHQHGLLAAVPRVLASPEPYLFVAFSGMGFVVFQAGLQKSRASIIVPIANVLSTTYLVVLGTPLFSEHFPSDPGKLALRMAGLLATLIGMVLFARGPAPDPIAGTADLTSAFATGIGTGSAAPRPRGDEPSMNVKAPARESLSLRARYEQEGRGVRYDNGSV